MGPDAYQSFVWEVVWKWGQWKWVEVGQLLTLDGYRAGYRSLP